MITTANDEDPIMVSPTGTEDLNRTLGPPDRQSAGRGSEESDLPLTERLGWFTPDLKACALRLGWGHEDAEDLIQDFFARGLRLGHFDRFDPSRGSARGFLLTLFRRFACRQFRRVSSQRGSASLRRCFLPLEGLFDSQCDSVLADWKTPARSLEMEEARALLEKVLALLQSKFATVGRRVLLDRLLEGWASGRNGRTYSEVAREFDLTEEVVKATGHRARLRLVVLLRVELAREESTKEHIAQGLRHLRQSLSSVG